MSTRKRTATPSPQALADYFAAKMSLPGEENKQVPPLEQLPDGAKRLRSFKLTRAMVAKVLRCVWYFSQHIPTTVIIICFSMFFFIIIISSSSTFITVVLFITINNDFFSRPLYRGSIKPLHSSHLSLY